MKTLGTEFERPSPRSSAQRSRTAEPLADSPLSRHGRDYRTRRMLATADVAAVLVAIASFGLTGPSRTSAHALWALLTIPLWLVLFVMYGLYSSGLRRVGHSTVDDIPGLAHAFLVGAVGMWLYFQVTPAGGTEAGPLLGFALIGFVADVALRSLARRLSRQALGDERIMFVGSGPMTPVLVRQVLRQTAAHGIEPVGVLTRAENRQWPLPITSLGALGEVDAAMLLRKHRVDRVVVSAEGIEDELLLELVDLCRTVGVKVSALPSLAAMIGPAATIDQLEGVTVIGLNGPSLARSSRLFKRVMDLVGASILFALTSPLLIVAAIAIKLDSPGPILFRQERIGRGGRPFRLAKFRSMVVDAEARREALLSQSRQAAWLDLEDDPRITRVGRLLRHTSIDELPQLWNVLRGDMSLVGPRPLVAQEDQNVCGWARGRLDLTPGITGMWQVAGRVQIPFEQMIMMDYLYVSNWSLWTDITLLLKTLPVVFSRRGAN